MQRRSAIFPIASSDVMLVKDAMSTNPVSINRHEYVTRAREIMRDLGFQSLPVLDDEGRVFGMVTIQDIIKVTSTRSNVTVNGYVRWETPVVSPDIDLAAAARAVIKTSEGRIPVVDKDSKLVGILSIVDVFKGISEFELVDEPVSRFMTRNVVVCQPGDDISRVWVDMIAFDITGFPVVNMKQEVIGMITRSDIMKRGYVRIVRESENGPKTPSNVQYIMSTPAVTVSENDSIRKVARIFLERNIGRVPVVNNGRLVGIVDRYDVITACRRPMIVEQG